ncbi:13812_t:CDS:1, partial [Cetraspora pellucida]
QTQKRPSKNTTKNKSFSKIPKQNKEKGDKKDSNTVKKLIIELTSNTSEQNTDMITSYPLPIDFLNLYSLDIMKGVISQS